MPLSGWDVAVLLAKAATYAATLCAAGCVFFLAYSRGLLESPERGSIRRVLGILLAGSAIAGAATILLLAASMSGDFTGMFDTSFIGMLLRGGEGRAGAVRMAGLAGAIFALSKHRLLQAPAIVGAILAATSFAWVGHVHALRPNTLPTLILGLHLSGAAFWLGALTPLLIVARQRNAAPIGLIAARFGRMALGVVGTQLVAGAILLWLLIADAARFWRSDYGRMLAMKLVAVALLLGVAALNKLYLTPRLLRGDISAAVVLRRAIKVEMLLGGVILLLTAAFTTMTGPPH